MSKIIVVTPAQRMAARALISRAAENDLEVKPAVHKIAEARRASLIPLGDGLYRIVGTQRRSAITDSRICTNDD